MYSRKSSQTPLLSKEWLALEMGNIEHDTVSNKKNSLEVKRLSKSTKEVILSLLASKELVDEKQHKLDRSRKCWNYTDGSFATIGITCVTYGILADHMDNLPYRKYANYYLMAGAIILLFVLFHRAAQLCEPSPTIKSLDDDDRMRVNAAITDGKQALLAVNEDTYFHINKYNLKELSSDIERLYQTIMKEISERNMRGIRFLETESPMNDLSKKTVLEYLGVDIPRIAPHLLSLGVSQQ